MRSKKTSPARKQKDKKIGYDFMQIDYDNLATQSGFKKRQEKKLSGKNLVIGFMLMSVYGINTFSQWAQEISWMSGYRISKQAVFRELTKVLYRLCY
jgi:hypothetical protein